MASLKLVNNTQGINYLEYRDRDFFSKFKYRARLRLHGLGLTYYCNNMKDFLDRLAKSNSRWRKIDKDLVQNNLAIVQGYLDFKQSIKLNKNFVIRLEGDTAGIFSNDLDKLKELTNIPGVDMDITEAVTTSYEGVKYFVREPKHKYRIYFRSMAVEQSHINELREILSKNKHLYPSKGLTAWLYRTRQSAYYFRFLSSSFNIDFDDESTGTYLSLILGDKLGHRFKLEKRPDTI